MFNIINGDMLEELDKIEENSVDAIVTDPPYEISFMNKSWDSAGVSFRKETWEKCLRVLKPGAHLLAFGSARTFHRIACSIEDGGFEIRDTIMWVYGSGFPKSMNIGNVMQETEHNKMWEGWGTQLKPAYEPIILARKPLIGNMKENIINYKVGGLNIDECRVPAKNGEYDIRHYIKEDCFQNTRPKESKFQIKPQPNGRFPANLILTYDKTDYEEVCGGFPITGIGSGGTPYNYAGKEYNNRETSMFNGDKPQANSNYNDSGSAARYFYCSKASKRDRDEGLEKYNISSNTHPTVKPVSLMQYLIRLITPKNGTILDPFMGSGSTGKAVEFENKDRDANYTFIGIEQNQEYCKIARARIEYVLQNNIQSENILPKSITKENSRKNKLF